MTEVDTDRLELSNTSPGLDHDVRLSSGGSQPGYNLKYSKSSTIMPTKRLFQEMALQKGVVNADVGGMNISIKEDFYLKVRVIQ